MYGVPWKVAAYTKDNLVPNEECTLVKSRKQSKLVDLPRDLYMKALYLSGFAPKDAVYHKTYYEEDDKEDGYSSSELEERRNECMWGASPVLSTRVGKRWLRWLGYVYGSHSDVIEILKGLLEV